jgi:pectate lyase
MGSSVFVENNYFRSTYTLRPMMMAGQGTDIRESAKGTFSSEDGGFIKAYGNTYDATSMLFVPYSSEHTTDFDAYVASSRNEVIPETIKTTTGGTAYNNFDTKSSMYSYTVQTPEEAKNSVMQYAGRVQGGDFKWSFDNSVDDKSSDVNQPLKNALIAYSSKLLSVQSIGEQSSGGSQGGQTDPTPSVTVDDVIALISALPDSTSVTESDRTAIMAAKSAFDSLSTADQNSVTNKDKLAACIAALPASTSSGLISFDASSKTYTVSGNLNATISLSGYKKLKDLGLDSGLSYGGNVYDSSAKFDTKSSIKITLESAQTVRVFVKGKAAGNTLYVGSNVLTSTLSIEEYSFQLPAGEFEIKCKSGETYVFLVVVE